MAAFDCFMILVIAPLTVCDGSVARGKAFFPFCLYILNDFDERSHIPGLLGSRAMPTGPDSKEHNISETGCLLPQAKGRGDV